MSLDVLTRVPLKKLQCGTYRPAHRYSTTQIRHFYWWYARQRPMYHSKPLPLTQWRAL